MAYLVHDVLERIWAINGEANKYDVCLGVRERAQPVVLFLPSSIPESQLDHLACWWMRGVSDVVLEDGRNIFLRHVSTASRPSESLA
jgi:hypothetical protein